MDSRPCQRPGEMLSYFGLNFRRNVTWIMIYVMTFARRFGKRSLSDALIPSFHRSRGRSPPSSLPLPRDERKPRTRDLLGFRCERFHFFPENARGKWEPSTHFSSILCQSSWVVALPLFHSVTRLVISHLRRAHSPALSVGLHMSLRLQRTARVFCSWAREDSYAAASFSLFFYRFFSSSLRTVWNAHIHTYL